MVKKIELLLDENDDNESIGSPITAQKVQKVVKQKETIPVAPIATPVIKEKRKMSQESLDKLALAREKAFQVRKQNADLKKQIAEEELLKKSGKQITKKVEKMKQQLNVHTDTEEDDEEEEKVKPIKKVASKKKKIVYESEDSEEEEEIVYVRKPKASQRVISVKDDRQAKISAIQWV